MTTISSVSSAWSGANVQRAARPAHSPERLLAKVDTDGNGSVDAKELQSMLDKVAQKTGVSSETSAADLLAKYDSNGNGNLSADELAKGLESVMPKRSTVDFAQSRSTEHSGQAGHELFGKADADGDGSVSQSGLQNLLEKMSGGTASATGTSSDALFSQLDTDGNGSLSQAEFNAGQSSGQGSSVQAAGGMPPPPPPGGAGGASASSSASYDPLDTNQDGVVSAAELAAAGKSSGSGTSGTDAITSLFNAIDTNGDKTIGSSESQSFIDQLTRQYSSATSQSTESSASSGDTRSSLMKLAELARQQYASTASSSASGNAAESLSAMA